ncbi:endolytic transglycosylase MltG [Oscillatoria sp. FACHB-1406]|uniref:endolytic transglycosylase MltG n=1 Tax=Oscillatoria sp. FACHB-1406 TaxID=2692846 RepID=UPI001685D0BC|nr:endolytic transglycosylase MltG [Oscillatoria sp. FACHB-1406]
MNSTARISRWTYYGLVLPLALIFCGWQGWAWWNWAIAPTAREDALRNAPADILQITVPKGTSIPQLGSDLKAVGLIRSDVAWKLWASWLKLRKEGGFQPGVYRLSPQDSLVAIADKIWRGESVRLSFTVTPGQSYRQMAIEFAAAGYFSEQDFLNAVRQIPRDKYPWLPANLPHLEGFLFPDTYEIKSDRLTPKQAIDMMLDRFQKVALPQYQQLQGKNKPSLLDWVTLASLVQKETAVEEERLTLAGVFAGRLREGLKLESDPTVEYILGIQQAPEKSLTAEQIQVDSPYNTYLKPGLPPAPIASPGLASLQAALSPPLTPYRFFVTRPDGTHLFTKTQQENEIAKQALQKQQNN